MLLSDVVKVLGDRPLGDFPWGGVVRDTVNLFAEINLKLTLTSTGDDLTRALDGMSESNRALLNSAQLDTSRTTVITPAGGGMVVEHGDVPVDATSIVFNKFHIVTATVVVMVLMGAMSMFASLGVNKGQDWKEVGKFIFDAAKSYLDI